MPVLPGIERYNPERPQWFDQLKSRSIPGTTAVVLTTEHIGNTSVPGMTVKSLLGELCYFRQVEGCIKNKPAVKLAQS
jgi:GrpB-like predicted nucleotidyltransferase (UPF0157 family)